MMPCRQQMLLRSQLLKISHLIWILTYFLDFEIALNFNEVVDLVLEAGLGDRLHGLGGHLEFPVSNSISR